MPDHGRYSFSFSFDTAGAAHNDSIPVLLGLSQCPTLPGALRRAAELMHAHPEIGLTFGNVIELRDGGTKIPVRSVVPAGLKSDSRIMSLNQDVIGMDEARRALRPAVAGLHGESVDEQ